MFTFSAILLMILLAWLAKRKNAEDRPTYDQTPPDLREWLVLLHARQDLKVIVFLLAGILVMLGVIADRIHW
jgi:hypothetical protein